jgi:hypothetical protein
MSDSADDDFVTLKPSLRRAIDTAFIKLVKQSGPARKKRRVEQAAPEEDDEGGGFTIDDESA